MGSYGGASGLRSCRFCWGDYGFFVFTDRGAKPTTSGGPIFLCLKKDRGERRAKGIAIPLNPLGLIVTVNRTYFGCTTSQRCV